MEKKTADRHKVPNLNLRLNESDYVWIVAYASKHNCSLNSVLKQAVQEFKQEKQQYE